MAGRRRRRKVGCRIRADIGPKESGRPLYSFVLSHFRDAGPRRSGWKMLYVFGLPRGMTAGSGGFDGTLSVWTGFATSFFGFLVSFVLRC
jgi:hypothetical protein